MRLLLISIGSVLFCLSILTGARIWGLGQSHPPFEHVFTQAPTPWIGVWSESLEQGKRIVEAHPTAILMIPVRVSKDYKLYVMNNNKDAEFLNKLHDLQMKTPNQQILKGGRLSDYPIEDIEAHFGKQALVTDFLSAFPNSRFILHVIDNAEGVHIVLRDALKPLLAQDRLLINSDADVVIMATKEQMPEWLYGSGHGALMRLLSFESISLEVAAPFKGDVLVSPLKVLNRPMINQAVVNEGHRRNKKVLLGPLLTQDEVEQALAMKVDGYIFSDLELANNNAGKLNQ